MIIKLDSSFKEEISMVVYELADRRGYLGGSKNDNGLFMEQLSKMPEVGGRLAAYMPKDKIKTYIKDSILHNYVSDKRKALYSSLSYADIVKTVYACDANEYAERGNVKILISKDTGKVFFLANGDISKWESALRSALEQVNKSKTAKNQEVKICLVLAVLVNNITDSDKKLLINCLSKIDIQCYLAKPMQIKPSWGRSS